MRLDLFVAEEADLVIPVSDRPLPVSGGQPDALLVDEEILTNTKPAHCHFIIMPLSSLMSSISLCHILTCLLSCSQHSHVQTCTGQREPGQHPPAPRPKPENFRNILELFLKCCHHLPHVCCRRLWPRSASPLLTSGQLGS